MKHDPDVASLLAALRAAEAGDPAARAQVSAAVAALKELRRDRPDLFPAEAARMVRPAEGPPAAAPSFRPSPAPRGAADPDALLRDVFGFPSFRPGQRELVDAVLAGRDALGVLPTGSGKSLTYQLPARALGGVTLVVSPLVALMKDQVEGTGRVGLRATFLNSTLDAEERRRRAAAIRRGEFELVYAAPEGLEGAAGAAISGTRLSLVAVDEAHCISHWGHDFRPAYRNLAGLRERFGGVPVLALTATATPRVAADIAEQLRLRDPAVFRGSVFRPNLHLRAVKKGGDGPGSREAILDLVRARRGQSGIVYCIARKSAESVAAFLQSRRVKALAYHAGLEASERERVQDAFLRGQADVVVATVAFGMGIDKPDIRYVVHRDMPGSVEGYCQEIGRAGRDGEPSDCVLLYSWADVMAHDRLAEGAQDPAAAGLQRRKARDMFDWAEAGGCRHRLLGRHFGEDLPACGSSCDACAPAGTPAGTRGGATSPPVRAVASRAGSARRRGPPRRSR